jgi:hypothetical protein
MSLEKVEKIGENALQNTLQFNFLLDLNFKNISFNSHRKSPKKPNFFLQKTLQFNLKLLLKCVLNHIKTAQT